MSSLRAMDIHTPSVDRNTVQHKKLWNLTAAVRAEGPAHIQAAHMNIALQHATNLKYNSHILLTLD